MGSTPFSKGMKNQAGLYDSINRFNTFYKKKQKELNR